MIRPSPRTAHLVAALGARVALAGLAPAVLPADGVASWRARGRAAAGRLARTGLAPARIAAPALVLVLAGTGLGCHPGEPLKPVVPARGEVSLDGKPGSGLLVVFHPTDDPVPNALDPRAVVEADGSFAVSTHNARDGAPPGAYRVTIHDPNAAGPGPEGDGAPPPTKSTRTRLPGRYADPARSGLEATVRPDSPNAFTFRLSR